MVCCGPVHPHARVRRSRVCVRFGSLDASTVGGVQQEVTVFCARVSYAGTDDVDEAPSGHVSAVI